MRLFKMKRRKKYDFYLHVLSRPKGMNYLKIFVTILEHGNHGIMATKNARYGFGFRHFWLLLNSYA